MTVRPLSHDNVPVRERLAAVLDQLERIVVGKPLPIRLALACLLARGHLLIEDIPGVGKSTLAQALATVAGPPLRPRAVHERPAAGRRAGRVDLRHAHAVVPLPSGPDLQFGRARRRDQPRTAEDAERAARGDGRAAGVAGRADATAARSLFRHRHPEPGRAGRRLSAARIAARPLPDGDRARLPRRRCRARAPDRRRSPRADPAARAARRSADAARLAARSGDGPRLAGAARLRAGAARRHPRQHRQRRRRRRPARPLAARAGCC